MAAISREVSNYIKIALLVLRISPKAVRVKFDIEFHPERLRKTLDENFRKLQELYQRKRILSKEQWNLLFPSKGKGEISSQNFDITLMMLLIRNLTEITISSILPLPFQMGLGDDLSRIHFYRNKIAHVDDATLSDTEFTKYWEDITQNSDWQHLENKVMELTDKMSNLEEEQEDPIPKNIRVIINKQIEGWKRKDNCYDDIFQWLLCNDVNVNQRREDGVTALIMASAYGYLDIVTMLLRHNPDVNLSSVNKATALYMACQNNHLFVVEELLKYDINVDLCDEKHQSPLFIACRSGWNAMVKQLLRKSPNVNQDSNDGLNSLHVACLLGHTAVVTLLLASKNVDININARDVNGYTPLFNACFQNFTEIASILINAKADVDIQTSNGATALCLAVGYNNIETTELLLTNNASWQIGFQNRQQLIDAMLKHTDITLESVKEEIRNFVVKNASPTVIDYVNKQSDDYLFNAMAGSSPLHIASFMGHTNIVSCLLNFGAYVDFAKEDGTTPLFFACELGHDDIVRLLLDNEAEVNIRRQDTRSPLDIAEYNGHRSVVTMLRERRVD
ncbi:unnamed protein product [Mytilus edulis]|uniref:DZIP3-like HEPN domain-containing protein n=1 Tax=Mytilus edulis TaxID=6550 RepID=A0A8S3TFX2_MYTED|nr:unnamed protein product [Mytilus edulis]